MIAFCVLCADVVCAWNSNDLDLDLDFFFFFHDHFRLIQTAGANVLNLCEKFHFFFSRQLIDVVVVVLVTYNCSGCSMAN